MCARTGGEEGGWVHLIILYARAWGVGLMGEIDGKGTPRWESRSGDFYRTGETRLQGRGKGVS